ncbi:hypothetical protein F3Y22_tig00111402pilonHSYRG00360 [Hibiscus syriacus]|uniref:C2 domain-containing protein n=1 Tax=Hibiscus syriacus TaxID=106335 RepID=A0A6A2Y9D5_HIBSY|nr:hypothetical protein F3Y22_tig00111402pilonHSYRG00360 [Hibiscus syriacus]
MQKPPQAADFALKETSPNIGVGALTGDKLVSTYDLVEQMQYLYVRVVKAKDLPGKDVTGSCDPYVEVKLGNYKGITKHFQKKSNPEWNQVFAFSKERIQASVLEVYVKDKDVVADDLIGRALLEDRKGNKVKGELMLAVWMGTQADEAFPDSWHSDAASVGPDAVSNIRSKVYLSPKLWYVRVNVIEAQDLVLTDKSMFPEVFVKAVLGNQALRTRVSQSKTINPMWNEDLMFVAAEPFEEPLVLSVEDRVGSNKDESLGMCVIPLHMVQRGLDHKPMNSRWLNLEKHVIVDGEKKVIKFASRINLRICLEGGYHDLDESTHYSSDLRPTAKQLWRPSIGILELGILSAHGLMPMKMKDGRGTTDSYCVAKYGQKWVRTRTIIDNFVPRWNEQYTWEVFDTCTVITVGVFDNARCLEASSNADCLDETEPGLASFEEGSCGVHARCRFTHVEHEEKQSKLLQNHGSSEWVDCCWKMLILPTVFLYLFLIGIWNYRWRPRHPPHMDTRLSHADATHPDELDEEFDTFPTSRPSDIVRMRYDRIRSIAGRVQTVIGDLATQGEKDSSLC